MLVRKESGYYLLYTKLEGLKDFVEDFDWDIEEDLGVSSGDFVTELEDLRLRIFEADFMNKQ